MFERGGCYSRLLESRLPPPSLFDTYFILDVLNFVKRHFAKFTCPRVYEFYERGTQFALRGGEKKSGRDSGNFALFTTIHWSTIERLLALQPTERRILSAITTSQPFSTCYRSVCIIGGRILLIIDYIELD